MLILNIRLSLPQDETTTYHLNQNSIKIAADPTAFISVWATDSMSTGSSASNQVYLPLIEDGTYIFTVNWGDGSNNTITQWNQTEVIHKYSVEGVYTVVINGTIIGWRFNDQGDKLKIIEIQQWGCLQLGNTGSYFLGCENLILTTIDTLNFNRDNKFVFHV